MTDDQLINNDKMLPYRVCSDDRLFRAVLLSSPSRPHPVRRTTRLPIRGGGGGRTTRPDSPSPRPEVLPHRQ
jgi:hypothetical protein